MAKYLKYHKNYTEFGEPYRPVLLHRAYSTKGRNSTVAPKTIFMILTCAYSQNIYSPGKIKIARARDVNFMHMKDDHMRDAQLKPGYIVQIAADSEYIVAAGIFQNRNNVWTLSPFLEG